MNKNLKVIPKLYSEVEDPEFNTAADYLDWIIYQLKELYILTSFHLEKSSKTRSLSRHIDRVRPMLINALNYSERLPDFTEAKSKVKEIMQLQHVLNEHCQVLSQLSFS